MDVTGAGTAVMIAIAAALWFAYFVPTWMRRREYLDTERTATRLQQTLRVMAETAELPDQVRVEVNARDAARQERLLRAQQRRADALAERAIAEARAAAPDPLAGVRTRRRRAHRLASLLMIAATITLAIQFWLMASGNAGQLSWLVIGAGSAIGLAGISVRRRVDARAVRQAPAAATRATTVAADRAAPAQAQRVWTPVPVPAPLYLSRPEPQRVRPALDLAAQLREAAMLSEQEVRDAHEAPEVIPFRRPRPAVPEPSVAPTESPAMRAGAAPSRWAAMGRVDGTDAAAPDLDEVLRRRRTAG